MTSIILPRSKTDQGIAYHRSGNANGIPLLLIHGVGLRAESWYQQIDALAPDYDVYAVDMPGHGESDILSVGSDSPILADFTDCLAQFMTQTIGKPAVILGHSMGALLALSLAKSYPDLCLAIVPMNAIYRRTDEAKQAVLSRAKHLREQPQSDPTAPVKRWFSETPSTQDQSHAAMCCEWLQGANLQGYADAYTVFSEEDGLAEAELQALDLPCLFITGELDANSTPDMSDAMAQQLKQAESLVIRHSRHMTPLTHAAQVNDALLMFLNQHVVTHNTTRTEVSS